MSYSYHPGERAVQTRLGLTGKADHLAKGVRDHVPAVAADFLRKQCLLAISARDSHGALWVSPLTSAPGFADLIDERTVLIRTHLPPCDPLAGAFGTPVDCGLIALDPAGRRRMRINGTAVGRGTHLEVHVDKAFSNCPKYIQRRERNPTASKAEAAATVRAGPLTPPQRSLIDHADTFFIGTHVAGRGADCSHRGGNPGFVRTHDDLRLRWPDYPGNAMYATLGNLELDPTAALLFLDWECGHTLQLTGRAAVIDRTVEFAVAGAVETTHRLPHTWKLLDYSPANPGHAAPADEPTAS